MLVKRTRQFAQHLLRIFFDRLAVRDENALQRLDLGPLQQLSAQCVLR
jgi:hypothetical protein